MSIFRAIISIDTWSKRKQFGICLAVGILILILGYGSDIIFLQRKLKFIHKQIVTTRELIQKKKKMVQQNPKLLPAQYVAKSDELKSGFEVINVLNGLEKAIFEARVEPSLFEPQVSRENEFLIAYPIKLEISGGYKNLIIFINNMLKQPYLVVIEETNLQKKVINNIDNLNMQVLLAVYKNKKIETRSMINKLVSFIQIPERDIFKQSNIGKNLFLWSSKELRFLGLIKQSGITFGIISDPLGGVHRVVVGDKMGLNQSKITAIDENGVITVNQSENVYRGK